jgi:hypothetical protein
MTRTTLIILLGLVSFALADARQSQDSGKPAIYLTFERVGGDDSVWLRLHNNTPWAVSFRTEHDYQGKDVTPLVLGEGRVVPGLADGLEVTPEYFIEHATDRVTTSARGWCTATTSWLPPGRSVVFSFPREALKSWEEVYIRFTYEWEGGGHDPEHRVKFSGFDLSKVN